MNDSYNIYYFMLKFYYFIFFLAAMLVAGLSFAEFCYERICPRNTHNAPSSPSAQVDRLPKVKKYLIDNIT